MRLKQLVFLVAIFLIFVDFLWVCFLENQLCWLFGPSFLSGVVKF